MPPKVKVQVKGNAKKYSEYLTEEFRLNNNDVKLSGSKIREIATEAMEQEVFKKKLEKIKANTAYDKLINATKNILRGDDQKAKYVAMKFFKDKGIAISDGQRGTRWYILPPNANINDEDIVYHVGTLKGDKEQGAQNPEHKDPNEGLSDDEKVVSEALAETGVTMAELQEANIQLAKDNKEINEKLVNMANAYEKQLRETNDRMDKMQSDHEKAIQEAISKKEKLLEKARGLRDENDELRDENDELRVRLRDIYDQNGQEDEGSDGSDGMQSAVSMEIEEEEEEEEQTDVWGRVSDIFGIRKAPKAPVLNKKQDPAEEMDIEDYDEAEARRIARHDAETERREKKGKKEAEEKEKKDEDEKVEELFNEIYKINKEYQEQLAGTTVANLVNAVPKPPLDANEARLKDEMPSKLQSKLGYNPSVNWYPDEPHWDQIIHKLDSLSWGYPDPFQTTIPEWTPQQLEALDPFL